MLSECVSSGTNRAERFKNTSAAAFGSSADWARNKAYEHKYTKTGNTSPDTTTLIRVWKSTATDLYLFISSTTSGTETRYFLRLPLTSGQPGSNIDMIDDLKVHACFPLDSEDDESYTELTGSVGGPATAKKVYTTAITDGTKLFVEYYTFNFNNPAWIGMYQKKVTITTRNSSGTATGAAEEFTSTFAAKSGEANLSTNHLDSFFHNSGEATARYCEIIVPATDATYTGFEVDYKLPFTLPAITSCATAVPGTWTDFTI